MTDKLENNWLLTKKDLFKFRPINIRSVRLSVSVTKLRPNEITNRHEILHDSPLSKTQTTFIFQ